MVSISWGWVSVSWGWVSISWGWVTISWSWVSISWSWVGWHASHEGECKKCEKSLKVTNNMNEYEHDSGIYCNVWSNIIIYTISYSGYISNDNKNVLILSMKWLIRNMNVFQGFYVVSKHILAISQCDVHLTLILDDAILFMA
jgi:hypothetical protein